MADTSTTTRELKIDQYFVDGDTRMITLKNPSSTLTSAKIQALQTWMQTNQPLIGDKLGAAFGKITSATVVSKTELVLDIDN